MDYADIRTTHNIPYTCRYKPGINTINTGIPRNATEYGNITKTLKNKSHRINRRFTLLEPQSRFGDNPIKFQVVCPHNGTAVLKGSS